jgi:CO/xanthine dehydrogenase Mo-binding subunit
MTIEATKVIGKAVPILEARDKVTGRAEYVDDMKADLFVKILGSPHADARIKSIDISRAEKKSPMTTETSLEALLKEANK